MVNHINEVEDERAAISLVLEDSIKKWSYHAGMGLDYSSDHFQRFYGTLCPICSLFTIRKTNRDEVTVCGECPLFERGACCNSPEEVPGGYDFLFWKYKACMKKGLNGFTREDRDRAFSEAEGYASAFVEVLRGLSPDDFNPHPDSLFSVGSPRPRAG